MIAPHGADKVAELLAKGVTIPHPSSVYVADEVRVEQISGDAVVLLPGTRVHGARTTISAGCVLSGETPATVQNCQLGPGVELKGGFFDGAVFLAGSSMGSGAHVRGGTICEEQSSGAHTVGLKQTILFPFATLGSLINFCDCLLSGGTSRSDHSEVGSSYIHFNFTPDGDKTTASLFGDVPRGVMLDQPPIFLGGQGGTVGPVHTGFGTVVGAGSILRTDVDDDGLLVLQGVHRDLRRPRARESYRGLRRLVERNLDYLASLVALGSWYRWVRKPFFDAQELGPFVYAGALDALASARTERTKRLHAMIGKVSADVPGAQQLQAVARDLIDSFAPTDAAPPSVFLDLLQASAHEGTPYVTAIQALPADAKLAGTAWLDTIIDGLRAQSRAMVPDLGLFTA